MRIALAWVGGAPSTAANEAPRRCLPPPCGSTAPAYYSAALNSFVHVVMYSYYLLSTLGVKGLEFIKHRITAIQVRRTRNQPFACANALQNH